MGKVTTKREWLVQQGLAKAGSRGRFSAEALVALDKAIDSGVTFDEPEVKPRVVRESAPARPVITAPYDAKKVRAWATSKGIQVGVRGRIPAEVVAQYLSEVEPESLSEETDSAGSKAYPAEPVVVREKVRTESVAYGYARRGADAPEYVSEPLVAITSCGGCGNSIAYCPCSNGPVTPEWMGSEKALLDKPVS